MRGGAGRGWCSPFIRAKGPPGRGGNGQLNGFIAIDGRKGLRRGLNGGFKVGQGKCLISIMRHETGVVGMTGGGGKW
jgi:hypothetical protein